MTTTKKPLSAVLGWFPTTPTTEREVLDMATSRQIALRTRLRHTYWLTDCKPLGPVTVAAVRRKMVLIDGRDAMTEPEVDELLSDHYGFAKIVDPDGVFEGWSVPELADARDTATASITATRERMSAIARVGAQKRAAGRTAGDVTTAPATSTAAGGDDDF